VTANCRQGVAGVAGVEVGGLVSTDTKMVGIVDFRCSFFFVSVSVSLASKENRCTS
jgi:hypothetical protein